MNTVPERPVDPTEANIVCVVGGPGVGKGTQCTRLAGDLKLVHISIGDLLRNDAEESLDGQKFDIKAIMGHASLVPHTYVHEVLQRCLVQHLKDGRSNFLIDGFPRSKQQAQFFETTKPYMSQSNTNVSIDALLESTIKLAEETEPKISECQMLTDNHNQLFTKSDVSDQQKLVLTCVLVRWIHGCWISTTLDYPGVEMQMKPLSLLAHLHLSALQNDLKTFELAVESTMYERLNNNTYKVDIDDLVEAIRLLFSNYTDSMDYDVQEVLLRYSHAKRQRLLAFGRFEAYLDPEKGLPSFINGLARQSALGED